MTTEQYINLFNEHRLHLINYIKTIGISEQDAEDVVSFSFMQFWTKKEDIDLPTAKTYLFELAKNKSIDIKRRNKIRLKVFSKLSLSKNSTDTISSIEINQIASHIHNIIESLPPKQKKIISLRYIDDVDIKMIIKSNKNLNRNTVRNNIVLGVNNIRRELNALGIDYD